MRLLGSLYENALPLELRSAGLTVEQQRGLTVSYRGTPVGEYFITLLVEGSVLIELTPRVEVQRVVHET